jgi:hypothetical protein
MNYDTKPMLFNGPLGDYDYVTLSWDGNPWADCKPLNFLNDEGYMFQQGYMPYIWYGYQSGIHGMNNTSDELHVCWKSSARGAPDNWIRLKSSIGSTFIMRILEYNNTIMQELPELESFDPPYGSTIATENTTEIRFNFHSEEVYAAEHVTHGTGILRIFRGAIKHDGTIDKAPAATVLWEATNLNDTAVNDKFKQGDVECSLAGKCIVHLSGSSILQPGEIYYLSFYPYSFKNSKGYYLFGATATPAVPLYEHMFQCRSIDIFPSDQVINGNFFNMTGVNLLSIIAYSKLNGNDIIDAKFETKALKLALRITNSTSCPTIIPPSASIKLEDMTETSFSVSNLDLLDCYQGDLYADFTLIRGIKESSGVWSHEKKEYLKDIKIGTMDCHSDCLHCSGPLQNQCILCSDTSYILSEGYCVITCPTASPYVQQSSILYNFAIVSFNYCTDSCGYDFFIGTNNICTSCSPQCLTCTGTVANSCTSCNDYRILYNGICLDNCLTPFYEVDRDNSSGSRKYTCVSTGLYTPLTVSIQDFGYEERIQKNLQAYAKAETYNANTSNTITSIIWSQVDPAPLSESVTIFFRNSTTTLLINSGDVVMLKMSAFNYMGTSQSVKLRVDVTDSAGNTAIDIKEFFLNEAPFAPLTTITGSGGVDDKEAMVTIFTIDVSSWYDSSEDTSQQLEFRTYFVYNKKNYMITSYTNTGSIALVIPYFSKLSATLADLTLCVQGKDVFTATTNFCVDYVNVTSNYDGDITTIFTTLSGLDMSNHDNMLKLSLYCKFLLTFMSFDEKTTDYSHPASTDYI